MTLNMHMTFERMRTAFASIGLDRRRGASVATVTGAIPRTSTHLVGAMDRLVRPAERRPSVRLHAVISSETARTVGANNMEVDPSWVGGTVDKVRRRLALSQSSGYSVLR